MIEYKVVAVCKCEHCEGEGVIYDPHCRLCNERIPSGHPWFSSPTDEMPCGHLGRKYYVDEYDCPYCIGTGVYRKEVPFEVALIAAFKDEV